MEEESIQLCEKVLSQNRDAIVGVQRDLSTDACKTTYAGFLPSGSNINILIITNRIHARLHGH